MAQVNAKTYLTQKIGGGELKEAIQLLMDILPTYGSEGILQMSRLSSVLRQESFGLATPDYVQRVKNQLTQAILPKVKEVPANLMIEVEDQEPVVNTINSPTTSTKKSTDQVDNTQTQIYFSYSWENDPNRIGMDDSREKMVDELYDTLQSEGYIVRRDRMDLEYTGLISEFMDDLGKADLIAVFLTDKYLRSMYCMHELTQIYINSQADKAKFARRVLPIRVEDIDLDSPQTFTTYFDHWNEKFAEWDKVFANPTYRQQATDLWDKFQKTRKIKDNFASVLSYFNDMNAKTRDLLSENDYALVKSTIKQRIKSLSRVNGNK